MEQYLDLMRQVLNEGEVKEDRTNTGTRSLFGEMCKYDLRDGFPLVTTKKVFWSSVVKELLWFLKGSTNTKDLGAKFWDAWADDNGELGPVYGKQWRDFGGVDQISQAIETIKTNPKSRRIIVSAWNPPEIPQMALPPCHLLFQFGVVGEYLDLIMYQRSCDLPVGVPFNIASYALLLALVANECGLTPRTFTHFMADAHIYSNQIEGVKEQLTREPYPLPTLTILSPRKPVLEITEKDIKLSGYRHHPYIPFPVAV